MISVCYQSSDLIKVEMLTQDYNRKLQATKKKVVILRKDIRERSEMVIRNQPTYNLDADIKGQFTQIDQDLEELDISYRNMEGRAKELNLMQRELDKRKQALTVTRQERNKLKRMYEQSVAQRIPNTRAALQAQNRQKFQQKYNTNTMSKQQLLALKQKHEDAQQDHLEGLIGTVRTMKDGQGRIRTELVKQEVMLNTLQQGMDDNLQQMSKVRRNMTKLLQGSSYWCLILIIILQVAAIVCNILFWPSV